MFCILLKKNVTKPSARCWSDVDSGNRFFFVLASYFCDCLVKFLGVCVVCVD